ncbi:PAS domain-containing protein [Pelagibius sp. CAU 1746]|uniref:PAS domain-containing protein n=1 Tax=Pelagibius sp. CAU 1746 TaxID=3140370 RepID=UPI00325AFC58
MTTSELDQPSSGAAAAVRFLERIDDPRLSAVYRYWNGLRRGRFAPSYAEVDPIDIPKLLPILLVTQVEETAGGRRYRYRLCGQEVQESFGSPMRGRYIDALMQGRYLTYIEDLYNRVVDGRRPIYSVSAYRGRALQTKRLMLPLSSDAGKVDVVLSAQVFFRPNGLPQTVLAVQEDFEPRG